MRGGGWQGECWQGNSAVHWLGGGGVADRAWNCSDQCEGGIGEGFGVLIPGNGNGLLGSMSG